MMVFASPCSSLASAATQIDADERTARLARMILFVLYGPEVVNNLRSALSLLASRAALRAEIAELSTFLRKRPRIAGGTRSPRLPPEVPLELHARYRTKEISTSFDLRTREGELYLPQTGVVKVAERHDALLITIDKSSKKKLPHLHYHDYALTPELFHWQSQDADAPRSGAW